MLSARQSGFIQLAEAEELALEVQRDHHTAPEDPYFTG